MGQTWSQETPESWNQGEVEKWKGRALDQQKVYYNGYDGAQFHSFERNTQQDLLKAKLCFAMYGPPTREGKDDSLLDGYEENQQKEADRLFGIIDGCYTESTEEISIMVIFVMCKMDKSEFPMPVIRVGLQHGKESMYVDVTGRTYKNWQDWVDNNRLPMMKYCYPKDGYYTSAWNGDIEYFEDRDPVVCYGLSPACNMTGRLARTLDGITGITALGSGGIAIVGMFTPLAPAVLFGGAIAGGVSALYGTGRSIDRLVDKKKHGESLTDLESITSWVAIALTPLAFVTSAVNTTLSNGARTSGRVFSDTQRLMATMLNLTNFGVQSGMIAIGFANMIEKAKKEQLTALDVLQFSMTIFFFTNTLIQPKTASGIISQAQNEHIQQYKESMADAGAQKVFEKFVNDNKGSGGMVDKSKIVRTINKIENPERVFNRLQGFDKIEIGGRKGRTLLVSNEGAAPIRIAPNKMDVQNRPGLILNQTQPIITQVDNNENLPIEESEASTRITTNVMMQEPDTTTVNSPMNNYSQMIATAMTLAEEVNRMAGGGGHEAVYKLILLAAKEFTGDSSEISTLLNNILGIGRTEFMNGIRRDMQSAIDIAARFNMVFMNPINAVCNYRQHGQDFIGRADPMDYYMTQLPQELFTTDNLMKIECLSGGIMQETYCSNNLHFGVLLKKDGKIIVATVFKNDRFLNAYCEQVANMCKENTFNPTFLFDIVRQISGDTDCSEFLQYIYINQR